VRLVIFSVPISKTSYMMYMKGLVVFDGLFFLCYRNISMILGGNQEKMWKVTLDVNIQEISLYITTHGVGLID